MVLNCGTLRGVMRWNTSTSPASMEAICAAGSEMKRNCARLSLIAEWLRKPSHLVSVRDEPLTQFSSLYGPVPTGAVALVAALLGSTMMAVA